MMDYRHKLTMQELTLRMARAARVVKLICGVGNNATALILLDANDKMKAHPNYRHRVKMLYRQAINKHRELEKVLLHTRTNRFFHIADMDDQTRKIYGNISDAEFFELWQGTGARAYMATRPLVTSLWNKYRLALIHHEFPHPDTLAWSMTAMAALELACKMYESSIRTVAEDHDLPHDAVERVFHVFNLKPVADIWRKAMEATEPKIVNCQLSEIDDRNIQMGIIQLEDAWNDTNTLFDMAAGAIEDFAELFRTKGEWKKALRIIKEAKQEAKEHL